MNIDTCLRKRFLALSRLGLISIFCAVTTITAQNIRNTDYSPDKSLKSSASVNPSTLAMELSIPIGGYAGRAGHGIPVVFSYSSKVWEMKTFGLWQSQLGFTLTGVRPTFAKRTAAGWTSTLGTPRIDYQNETYTGNSQEVTYEGQIYSSAPWEEGPNLALYYIRRLHIQMPDGSTHELRASDIPVYTGTTNGGTSAIDQTGTYLSVDGTRLRLESGTTESTLYLPDGSKYLFPGGSPNEASTFVDRHGNRMTFNSSNKTWTDTLGRMIVNPLAMNWNGTANQQVGTQTATFPGFGTGTIEAKFTWSYLKDPGSGESGLENPNDELHNLSDIYCQGNLEYPVSGPYLFANSDASVRICGSGYSSQGPPFNPIVLTKIELANQQSYQFKYNVHGEIIKIIYPTGATERFAYGMVLPVQVGSSTYDKANRGVTDRWVSPSGSGTDELHWHYQSTRGTPLNPAPYEITITAPDGTRTEQNIFDEPDENTSRPYGFSEAKTGRSYEDRVYSSGEPAQLLRRKLTAYEVTSVASGENGGLTATRDLRPSSEVSIIFEPGSPYALATMTETIYDTSGNSDPAYFSSLNPKQSKKHNFIVLDLTTAQTAGISTISAMFSNSTLATVTEMDYLYDANYKARNITGLVTETRVKDASGNIKAKSQVVYDEVAYPLIPAGTHSQWQDPQTSYRGNPTTTRSWTDIAANQYVENHAQYDNFGNLRKTWDAKGNLGQTDFSATYGYAYPTSVITPIPDPTGVSGSSTAFTTSTDYDFNTGLRTSTTDVNGQTTAISYADPVTGVADPLLRVRKVTAPNGQKTIHEYGAGTSASTRWVKVTTDLDETNSQYSISWFDGMGRAWLSQSEDSAGDVFAVTCYDNMGRVSKTSNPFRNISNPTCSSSLEWTVPTYDELGRTISVTTPDGAVVETAYSLATSGSQIGTAVTVADQAGKLRRSITNALGQLKRVDEPNDSGQLGNLDTPNQWTGYTYDELNNLTVVNQGVQTRTFTYDALSRLKQATNPESGTIIYSYDPNGNLTAKTDARGVVTSYAYDALNRVTQRSYSTPNGTPGSGVFENYQATPPVSYFYDNLPNAKGKLIKVQSSVSTTEYTAFDILGRVTAHKQTTDGVGYETGYTYNLSGAMVEQRYPSGRVVKNVLDASGDLSMVQSARCLDAAAGTAAECTAQAGLWNYARHFSYNAAGAVTSMQLGNGRWESAVFNTRLQPVQIALGSTGTAEQAYDLLKLDYGYGTTDNNGNVLSQTITVPSVTIGGTTHNGFTAVQTYNYDSLNRLKQATENITPNGGSQTQSWKQVFTFDRYGNRNFVEANTTFEGFDKLCSNNTELCAELRKILNPSANASDNRLSSSDGYVFDTSGNTVRDAESRRFTYDGENKQVKVETLDLNSNPVSTIGEYVYDGDGKRVKKHVPSTGEVTVFVYDAGGKLIGDYSTIVETQSPKVSYTTQDHLGSPRILTDQNGATISRRDFHPFGEQVARTGYGSDEVRKQFTGYERDNESNLDFAEARYYNFNHGRFTSPDDFRNDSDPDDPQSWNLYIYVRNKPLIFIDPTGKMGDYYERGTGRWLGNDGIDDDKVYVAKLESETVNEAGIPERVVTDRQDLGITHTEFVFRAGLVYGESTAFRSSANSELANEMNALAHVYARNSTAFGHDNEQAYLYFNTRMGGQTDKMKLANLAIINERLGGPDPSNGANGWDGMEQAMYPDSDKRARNPARNEIIRKNVGGWSISNEHYSKWKANVGRGFQAPQETPASVGPNKGKIRYFSRAVHGGTIFWRIQ